MTNILSLSTGQPPSEAPGKAFCAAQGLTDDLDQRLLCDPQGRPFEPLTLTLSDRPAEMAAQVELLLRPQAVGGAETLLEAARLQLTEAAQTSLRRRIAGGGLHDRLWPFLTDLYQELERLRRVSEQQAEFLERDWRACLEALRTWRDYTTREPGLMQHAWSWLFGSGERLSLPQAAAHWNERERLACRRQANQAARKVIGALADEVGALLDRQAALRQACLEALETAQMRPSDPTEAAKLFRPWSWQVHPDTLAHQLAQQMPLEHLLTALLGQIAQSDDVAEIAVLTRELALYEATRRVDALTLAEAITLEAGAAPLPDGDPLVLVGRQLLNELERRPPWRLRRGAQPHVEVVQVTANGEPLFDLDGLGSAAYGDNIDRIGFVRLDLGIAGDDLQVLHEGEAAFAEALAQRNLYVIEELAGETVSAAPSPAPLPNGQTLQTVWEEH